MDPATGTFTSMDTYAGSFSDPTSLHKYIFANANPLVYSDPSGKVSLTEENATVAIITILAAAFTINIGNYLNGSSSSTNSSTSLNKLISLVAENMGIILVFKLSYLISLIALEHVFQCIHNIEKPNSRTLRKNISNDENHPNFIPPDFKNAAHHIVAGAAALAARGREVLNRFGIGINDAINGVLLPIEQNVSDAIYHCSMHTNEYYETVNRLLESCGSLEEVIETLRYIAECLLDGKLP